MGRLQAGDWVEVRSKEEILRTLDKSGRLDGMPFMPQMFQYCGKRLRVYKRAHKTCDTIAIKWDFPGRSLPDGVHLNLRCDGKAYGGCQAACLLFWKEQWLKPIKEITASSEMRSPAPAQLSDQAKITGSGCTEEDVLKATRVSGLKPGEETVYSCQATRLLEYTKPLRWWDVRQYIEDYTSGNTTFWRMVRGFIYVSYYYPTLSFSRRYGGPARWVYDRFQALWGGLPFPRHWGKRPDKQPAPLGTLNLQPGELVRIKSYDEIRATLDKNNKHRGMAFDAELVPYCGTTVRVRGRVDKFIDEKTGKLATLKTPAVILDNVFCQARYSNHRLFCPRGIFSWWREAWLERVSEEEQVRQLESNSDLVPKLDPERCPESVQR